MLLSIYVTISLGGNPLQLEKGARTFSVYPGRRVGDPKGGSGPVDGLMGPIRSVATL